MKNLKILKPILYELFDDIYEPHSILTMGEIPEDWGDDDAVIPYDGDEDEPTPEQIYEEGYELLWCVDFVYYDN